MSTERSALKDQMIGELVSAVGAAMPTSSFGRLGRTAFAVLRSGKMIASARGRSGRELEPEVDLDKLVKVVTSIGRLKGVAMKMGQIMSYIDIAMPEEMRDALSVLQTHAQPMPWDKVRELVISELGKQGEKLLDKMEKTPVSAASIGQVHRAALPDGTEVAVKIQYPEIAGAIEADFGPAAIGTKMASLFYPHARIDDFVAEARDRFLEECDYLHEAHCQNRFCQIYEGHPTLLVPAVHGDFCSKRVLTTTFVKGLELDAFLASDPPQKERNKIGEALFEFYLGSLFRHQIYNCDPHPGNYLFLPDGRVAMLDHGCTRQFETKLVAKLANLTRAVHSDEREQIHRALENLKMVRPGKPYDYETIYGFLRSFFGPMLFDGTRKVDLGSAMEAREVIKKKQQLARFSIPGEFLFLFRIRFGLMSVLARIDARDNWYRLEKRYVEDFAHAHPLLSST